SRYDRILAEKLPAGADMKAYAEAAPGTEMANALNAAKSAAGPEILNATLMLPIALTVAFAGLYVYMRNRKKVNLQVV
ncbi:MAG TPA: MFS transporter, partial [Phnomibacter sp.]|nr:MFS transporter [Phnomibacter sp.]